MSSTSTDSDLCGKPGIIHPPTVVLLAVFPINVALNVALVHYTSLGIMGTPLAVSLTFYIAFTLLALYTARSSQHRKNQTWGGFRLRVIFNFRGCLSFTKLALPGVLMVGTEWAAFEIVALAAGRLGSTSLAAQSIIMTSDQSELSSEFQPVQDPTLMHILSVLNTVRILPPT